MIAVDTNVLVRLLVNDEPAQALRARNLFDKAAAQQKTIWVADTVLVELAWTLVRAYRRDRSAVAAALRALAMHATVKLESGPLVMTALTAYDSGAADFADCLLCAKAAAIGCDEVATFDRGMRALPGVRVLA